MYGLPYSFHWSGWLADYLQLIFTEHGVTIDKGIFEACCDLILFLPASISISAPRTSSKTSQQAAKSLATPLLALLGPFPRGRMCSVLQMVLGCRPTENHLDLRSAYENLSGILEHATRHLSCKCPERLKRCDWSAIYNRHDPKTYKKKRQCPRGSLEIAMKKVLDLGLLSLFIESGPNVTIRPPEDDFELQYGTPFAETPSKYPWCAHDLVRNIMRMVKRSSDVYLATSGGSSTIYPSILTTLQIPSRQYVNFSLVDGLIVYEQRYHTILTGEGGGPRPTRRKADVVGDIVPSHTGVHSGSALITIREAFACLELYCSIRYAGFEMKINLENVISGYIGLQWPEICPHPFDTPLNVEKYSASATDVAAPATFRHLGVAMTRGSPTAQLLCCQEKVPTILQRDCCLNCAAEALGTSHGVIIVG